MHLKWFKGRAVLDVMRRVREELGPEAVILRSKFVHPWGLLRLFGGSRVEILAAVDRPEAPATQAMLQVPPEASPSLDSLRSELAALRSLFLRSAGGGLVPAILGPLYEHLLAGGMDPALAMRILGSVPAHQLEQEAAKMATYRAVEEQMASLIAVSTCAAVSGQLRVAFVGPSGMGKTTTLAKMAARVRITGGSIAIVNADGSGFSGPFDGSGFRQDDSTRDAGSAHFGRDDQLDRDDDGARGLTDASFGQSQNLSHEDTPMDHGDGDDDTGFTHDSDFSDDDPGGFSGDV